MADYCTLDQIKKEHEALRASCASNDVTCTIMFIFDRFW